MVAVPAPVVRMPAPTCMPYGPRLLVANPCITLIRAELQCTHSGHAGLALPGGPWTMFKSESFPTSQGCRLCIVPAPGLWLQTGLYALWPLAMGCQTISINLYYQVHVRSRQMVSESRRTFLGNQDIDAGPEVSRDPVMPRHTAWFKI